MRQSGGTFLSAEEAGHELQTKTVFPKKEKKKGIRKTMHVCKVKN